MSYNCNCGPTLVQTITPCNTCSAPTCPAPVGCDPCSILNVTSTPMVQCNPVDFCTAGCEETVSDACVVHKGAPLSMLNVIDGESLNSALVKIDALLRELANLTVDMPTYNYKLVCLTNPFSDVRVDTVFKNGVSQLGAPQIFANAASVLAYLQTMDAAWLWESPNLFHIHSTDDWELEMSCP